MEILRHRDGMIFCPNKANLMTYYFRVGPTRRFHVSLSLLLYKNRLTAYSLNSFFSSWSFCFQVSKTVSPKWDVTVTVTEQCRLVPRVSFSGENVWKTASLLHISRLKSLTSLPLSIRFSVLVMSVRCCRWKFTSLFCPFWYYIYDRIYITMKHTCTAMFKKKNILVLRKGHYCLNMYI